MKNSELDFSMIVFFVSSLSLLSFMALSWFFGKPYRSNSFLLVVSVMVLATFVCFISEKVEPWLLRSLNYFGYVALLAGLIALGNLLLAAVWSQSAYRPTLTGWLVVLAVPFLATQFARDEALAEMQRHE